MGYKFQFVTLAIPRADSACGTRARVQANAMRYTELQERDSPEPTARASSPVVLGGTSMKSPASARRHRPSVKDDGRSAVRRSRIQHEPLKPLKTRLPVAAEVTSSIFLETEADGASQSLLLSERNCYRSRLLLAFAYSSQFTSPSPLGEEIPSPWSDSDNAAAETATFVPRSLRTEQRARRGVIPLALACWDSEPLFLFPGRGPMPKGVSPRF